MGLEKSKARHYQKEINYNKCFMISPKEAGDPELVKIHERYEEKMLEENFGSIAEIAEKCGFADSSGLIRAFKKYYNTTPYKYMKNINQISK